MEEAEAEIRLAVKNGYLNKTPKAIIDKRIKSIIEKALKSVKIKALREVSAKSLIDFYNKQWNEIRRLFNGDFAAFFLVLSLSKGQGTKDKQRANFSVLQRKGYLQTAELTEDGYLKEMPTSYGVPMQKYMQDYLNNNVKEVMKRLAETEPLDPEDTRKISLRARAELEVRYASSRENIADLRNAGERLVLCSSHSDCSERCAPYQGRLYSLDGTKGEINGLQYVPLEYATENPRDRYVTNAGRVYQNGLFGFNCRHKITPYRGQKPVKISKEEEEREYAITKRQRELERAVLKWRTRAIESIDKKEYAKARQKAREWNAVYIKYSKEHNRAYYPSRTKIL